MKIAGVLFGIILLRHSNAAASDVLNEGAFYDNEHDFYKDVTPAQQDELNYDQPDYDQPEHDQPEYDQSDYGNLEYNQSEYDQPEYDQPYQNQSENDHSIEDDDGHEDDESIEDDNDNVEEGFADFGDNDDYNTEDDEDGDHHDNDGEDEDSDDDDDDDEQYDNDDYDQDIVEVDSSVDEESYGDNDYGLKNDYDHSDNETISSNATGYDDDDDENASQLQADDEVYDVDMTTYDEENEDVGQQENEDVGQQGNEDVGQQGNEDVGQQENYVVVDAMNDPTLSPYISDCGEFGCCADGVHPAHGPSSIGCCAVTEFGCCPDYVTPAAGPYFQGCDCKSSEFGCCPDKMTPAKGPENEGCGCQYTEFGCCEDQKTQATGLRDSVEGDGCGCETSRHGCCPDGVTGAEGSNLEGCGAPCNRMEFGCCPDKLTPARGPEYQGGCGCESSKYGCCIDGSFATGPNHMGCLAVPGEYCHIPSERGSCSTYEEKWYYNMQYGGCDRFWYGGCEPGKNHFDSQEDCQQECVSPRGAGVCFLKSVVGPCKGDYKEWFYDAATKTCKQFSYGGCLGNGNRFVTKEDCESICSPAKDSALSLCQKPKAEGACRGNHRRWAYNKNSGECEEFNYSGCLGNNNRFMSKEECSNACQHEVIQRRTEQVCGMYLESGNCDTDTGVNATLARWGYSNYLRRCVPFYYTGCAGNLNNFNTLQECEAVCPTTFAPVITLTKGSELLLERGHPQARIPVVIKANPPAEVTWFHHGAALKNSGQYDVQTDFSLLIKTVSDHSAGEYTVTANNGIGNPTSAKVKVIVYPVFPKLSFDVDKTIYAPGSTVELLCKVRGYPIPGVAWTKKLHRQQEQPLRADNSHVMIESYHESTLELASKLTIRDVTDKDTATYTCSVQTDFSPPISKSVSMSIQYGPGERCVDRPSFAKYCPYAVKNRLCKKSYYGRFCCRSCAAAGYQTLAQP